MLPGAVGARQRVRDAGALQKTGGDAGPAAKVDDAVSALSDEARLLADRDLFADELSAELLGRLLEGTHGGFVLGSPKFKRHIAAMVGRRTWKGSLGRPREESDVYGQCSLRGAQTASDAC